MKSRLLLAFAFLMLAASVPAAEAKPLQIGASIPKATTKLKNVDGKDVTIAGVKGAKGTLVVFTCNGCPWVKKWEDRVAAIGNEAMNNGIGVIAINANDPGMNAEDGYSTMQSRAKSKGLKFAYAVDATSDVARAFGATRTPEAFLFDAKGKLVYHGTIDDNADDAGKVTKPYLKDAVNAVASGKGVDPAETKALGCGIKFRGAKPTT